MAELPDELLDTRSLSESLSIRIIGKSLPVFVVIVGVAVSTVLLPLYRDMRADAENELLGELGIRADAVRVLFSGEAWNAFGGDDPAAAQAEALERILRTESMLGRSASFWLISAGEAEPRFLAPLGPDRLPIRDPVLGFDVLADAVGEARGGNGRPVVYLHHPQGERAVAYLRVKGSRWGLVVAIDSREILASARRRLLGTACLVGATILGGIAILYALVRPLGRRLGAAVEALEYTVADQQERLRNSFAETERMREQLSGNLDDLRASLGALPWGVAIARVVPGAARGTRSVRILAANPVAASSLGIEPVTGDGEIPAGDLAPDRACWADACVAASRRKMRRQLAAAEAPWLPGPEAELIPEGDDLVVTVFRMS